jgi:hypothetical protein
VDKELVKEEHRRVREQLAPFSFVIVPQGT